MLGKGLAVIVTFSVCAAVAFSWARWFHGAAGAVSGAAQQAQATARAPTEAQRLAQAMLSNVAQRRFVGTIGFEFEMTPLAHSIRIVQQSGRLYVGANGEVRLDVWLEPGREPVICCLNDGSAWMVFTTSPLVHQSAYPISVEPRGFLGQLDYQVGQTLAWADLLLQFRLSAAADKPILEATLVDGWLKTRVGSNGEADSGRGALEIEAGLIPGLDGYYPESVTFEDTGAVFTFVGHESIGAGQVLAWQIDLLEVVFGEQTYSSWAITHVEPRDAADPDLLQCFEAPSGRDKSFPRLIGTCTYSAQAEESFEFWD